MRLSRFTDLGLRALMYLGSRPGRASASRIAGAYGVSRDHMMKVLQTLTDLEILEARVGRSGGFRLVADPTTLRVGDVVRKLEPHMELAECFGHDSRCPLTPDCRLREALTHARDAFLERLNDYTVADLVSHTPSLVELTHG